MNINDINPEMLPERDREAFRLLIETRNKILKALEQAKAANYDSRTKTVGDRVKIWDYSFAYVVEDDTPVKDLLDTCIVAADNQTYDSEFLGHRKTLDLIVWNSKLQKHIRTSSEFVKLV